MTLEAVTMLLVCFGMAATGVNAIVAAALNLTHLRDRASNREAWEKQDERNKQNTASANSIAARVERMGLDIGKMATWMMELRQGEGEAANWMVKWVEEQGVAKPSKKRKTKPKVSTSGVGS